MLDGTCQNSVASGSMITAIGPNLLQVVRGATNVFRFGAGDYATKRTGQSQQASPIPRPLSTELHFQPAARLEVIMVRAICVSRVRRHL